jgi:hypothetical protein
MEYGDTNPERKITFITLKRRSRENWYNNSTTNNGTYYDYSARLERIQEFTDEELLTEIRRRMNLRS